MLINFTTRESWGQMKPQELGISRVQVEDVSKVANNFHLAINELLPKNISVNR